MNESAAESPRASRRGFEQQIAKIRAKLQRDGGYTVGHDELRLLCPDYMSVSEQFAQIAAIAQKEQWSFAFLPHGGVHFGTYPISPRRDCGRINDTLQSRTSDYCRERSDPSVPCYRRCR